MRYLRLLALLSTATILSCSEEPERTVPSTVVTQQSDLAMLQEKVTKEPGDADAWFHLADLYERANQYLEQADALRKVVALRPEMGWAHFKLGTAYNRLQRYEEAVKSFRTAEKYVKDQPMLYNNLGVAYGKLGKPKEEIASLRKAVAIRPRYSMAHYNLGVALLRKGDRQGAATELRILQDLDEGTAAALKKDIDSAEKVPTRR